MPSVRRANGRRVPLPRLLRVERDGEEVVLLRHGEPSLLEDDDVRKFFATKDEASRIAEGGGAPMSPELKAKRRLQGIAAARRRLAAGGRP